MAGALYTGAYCAVYSKTFTQPSDFSSGIIDRVECNSIMGGLTLCKAVNCVPYLWIPSPCGGTVSKVEARTGHELARYAMGPKESDWTPCAVATDNEGNAYIACGSQGTGKIVKIRASAPSGLLQPADRTSFDFNGNGSIDQAEVLPWGQDSRVSLYAEIGDKGSQPSSLVFDENGYLWVGLWGEHSIVKVDLASKTVLATVPLVGRPDTMLVGPKGFLWVLSRDSNTLYKVNPLIGTVDTSYNLGSSNLRAMCLGDDGVIWIASSEGLISFEISSGSFMIVKPMDDGGFSGVAMDKNGDVWAASPVKNEIFKYSPTDVTEKTFITVGKTPTAISVDEDGYIWTLNSGEASATRVDPRTNRVSMKAQICEGASCNTPFAADILKRGISPIGSWKTLLNSNIPGAGWGTITWETANYGGQVKVQARSADLPTQIENQEYVDVSNGQQMNVPNGRYLEVKVTLTSTGDSTPILRGLKVNGRNLPPDVSHATPSTDRITKVDHTFEPVSITGVKDPEGDPVTITITGVTQDEPVMGLSVDDKWPDAKGIGTSIVLLRGECDFGNSQKSGNGRVYKVTFKATDALGASSIGSVKVTVPITLHYDDVAVDDGQKYDATQTPEERIAKNN